MAQLPVSVCFWNYDRTMPMADGRVAIEGCDATFHIRRPEDAFHRAFYHAEYDITELSFSRFMARYSEDNVAYDVIPVFPSRAFRHSGVYVNSDAGIRKPADLAGKRIGCAEYQLTANVWIRGILEDEYGLKPSDYTTFRGGMEEPGRIEKAALSLPPEVQIQEIGPAQTLSRMLESGDIDALFTPRAPSSFTQGTGGVQRLFEDTYRAERDYFERTRIFPIMHVIAVRREVYEENRWVAQSLLKGFTQAQQMAYQDLRETAGLKIMLPWLIQHLAETEDVMGNDFWPYGLEPNVKTLSTLMRYHYEQGLSHRQLTPEEIFAPETLEAYKI